MKTIITVILIIVAVAAVLFILPFAIIFFSYVFGIDMDENGGLHECIGCPYRTCPDCEKDCKISIERSVNITSPPSLTSVTVNSSMILSFSLCIFVCSFQFLGVH